MSANMMTGQPDPLFGDVNREAYIAQMREVAAFAGRNELTGEPLLKHTSWHHEDVATGLTFDSLSGGSRAEISANTLFRMHEIAYMSEDESAETVRATLKRFAGSGDNYQFSAALDKAEGVLKLELLDVLVDHEVMEGYPTNVVKWIQRAGGNTIGTEEHGYDLPFFEKVWELSQHRDIGLREKAELAVLIVDESTDIISENSWETPEGQAASKVWMERYKALQQEVDHALLGQAHDLIDGAVKPGEHTLHMLANDLETRILDRWRWYYETEGEASASEKVKHLVAADIQIRFMDTLAHITMAETAKNEGSDHGGNTNSALVTLMTFMELVGDDGDIDISHRTLVNIVARERMPEEVLTDYREQADHLQARLAELEDRPAATTHKERTRLKKIADFMLRRS